MKNNQKESVGMSASSDVSHLYTIRKMSEFTGISYQNLWYRLKKNNILPLVEKTGKDDSSKFSLKQFAQVITLDEAELLPEEIKSEIRILRTPTDSEFMQDIISRIDMLENHLAEQDKTIDELKQDIRKLTKKCKKK